MASALAARVTCYFLAPQFAWAYAVVAVGWFVAVAVPPATAPTGGSAGERLRRAAAGRPAVPGSLRRAVSTAALLACLLAWPAVVSVVLPPVEGDRVGGPLVALAWLPGAADPLTYVKLLFLAAGGLALAPAVYLRWKAMGRPTWAVLLPSIAAVLILMWGLVSTMGSSAPIWNTIFGWWGRGDGWLAWLGALILLLGAATLSSREEARTVTWLMGGASVVALIGLIQFSGVNFPEGAGGQVSGTMGNTNFAAGYFAIIGVLALGRALTQAVLWQRIWGAALFVILAFLAWQTDSVQGPAALAAGVVALGIAYALLYRGRFRVAEQTGPQGYTGEGTRRRFQGLSSKNRFGGARLRNVGSR
jgi:hypothetical protein